MSRLVNCFVARPLSARGDVAVTWVMRTRVVNLGHALTEIQVADLSRLSDGAVTVVDVPVHVDLGLGLHVGVAGIIDEVERHAGERTVLHLPSHPFVVALVLSELHGRQGEFPVVTRCLREPGPSGRWRIAELLDLQELRGLSRTGRRLDERA